jgi:hypothetical protein
MTLALVGVTNGAVQKGRVDLEFLGGLSIESGAKGSNQEDILAGATGADFDGWFVSGGISWFRTNNLQLGIAGFYSSMDGSETVSLDITSEIPGATREYDVDVDLMVYGVGGRAKWHFSPTKALVPFIGIQASWATADIDVSGDAAILVDGEVFPGSEVGISESDSASGILWGPILGLRLQLGENDDLLFEYQYRLWTGSIGDVLDNGHAIAIGLSHRMN